MHIHTREVESIYDVLGDIGGYYDIQKLLGALIMGYYSSVMFEGDLARKAEVQTESAERKLKENSFLRVMSQKLEANQNAQLNKSEMKDLLGQFFNIRKLAIPLCGYFCCPCFYRWTKEKKFQNKLLSRFERNLDIRRITSL